MRTYSIKMVDDSCCVHLCKSGSFIRCHPLINCDLNIVIVAYDSFIFIYNLENLKCLNRIKCEYGYITKITFSSKSTEEIIVGTIGGYLVVYNIINGEKLKEINTLNIIYEFFVIDENNYIFILKEFSHSNSDKGEYSICKGSNLDDAIKFHKIATISYFSINLVCYHKEKNWLCFLDNSGIILYDVNNEKYKDHSLKELPICMKFHHTKTILAYGFNNGCIFLIDFEKLQIVSKFHWHANPIGDMYFSENGRLLYSGGMENVLVKWEIESCSKTFIPRLGSPIKFIVNSVNIIILIHYNNDITIIDTNNSTELLQILDFERPLCKNAILKYESESDTIISNGKVGWISFFSPSSSKMSHSLEIIQQNYSAISFSKGGQSQYEVTHVHLSQNNTWFFTIEQTELHEFSRLKCWLIDQNKIIGIHHSIENPHNKKIIHIESYLNQDGLDILITISKDKSIKIWSPYCVESTSDIKYEWKLSNVVETELPPKYFTLSSNSSILVVITAAGLSFYSCPALSLIKLFPLLKSKMVIFGNFNVQSDCLIVKTNNKILFYDYQNDFIKWKMDIKAECILYEPITSRLCVFNSKNNSHYLTIYDWTYKDPIQNIKLPINFSVEKAVLGKSFTQTPRDLVIKSTIFFLTSNYDLYCVSEEPVILNEYQNCLLEKVQINDKIFESNKYDMNDLNVNSFKNINLIKQFVEQLSITPSHHLPSCQALNFHFLNASLPPYTVKDNRDYSNQRKNTIIQNSETNYLEKNISDNIYDLKLLTNEDIF